VDIEKLIAECKDLVDTLAESKKKLQDLVSMKANYYSLSGESVEAITQVVMFDCDTTFNLLKQEIFDFYSKRYRNEPFMHLVDAELESIKEEMKMSSMKIVLNIRVQEKIKRTEKKLQSIEKDLPKYS
jgi:N-acetyl-gamma-glutamylphosphate reductase